jgi:hypothetical protein
MVLDRFVEEHGKLPLYNRISGRRPTKYKMANDEVVPISIVVRLLKKRHNFRFVSLTESPVRLLPLEPKMRSTPERK